MTYQANLAITFLGIAFLPMQDRCIYLRQAKPITEKFGAGGSVSPPSR
jgi:hypothetical protein